MNTLSVRACDGFNDKKIIFVPQATWKTDRNKQNWSHSTRNPHDPDQTPVVHGVCCLCFISFCVCFHLISDEWKALLYQCVSQWLPSVWGLRSYAVVGGSGFIDSILRWVSLQTMPNLWVKWQTGWGKEKWLFWTCTRTWMYFLRTSLAARGVTFWQALIGLMVSASSRRVVSQHTRPLRGFTVFCARSLQALSH